MGQFSLLVFTFEGYALGFSDFKFDISGEQQMVHFYQEFIPQMLEKQQQLAGNMTAQMQVSSSNLPYPAQLFSADIAPSSPDVSDLLDTEI